jgi:glycosyltransferase involved in cell wall biosynthesis
LVADAFISLYDTLTLDRDLIRNRLVARLLLRLERRALACADVVIVDTPQNAAYLAQLFRLPESKFAAVPLQTNEVDYRPDPYRARTGLCTVLFTGTLVPLQGIGVIAEAIRRAAPSTLFRVRIIGDGQDAAEVRRLAAELPEVVSWERRWLSAAELAREIQRADICLGIFAANPKAQRVCPYKLYAYARVGRAVITGDTDWARSVAGESPPFITVPVGDAEALANAICDLSRRPKRRERMAESAARFYQKELASSLGAARLARLVFNRDRP